MAENRDRLEALRRNLVTMSRTNCGRPWPRCRDISRCCGTATPLRRPRSWRSCMTTRCCSAAWSRIFRNWPWPRPANCRWSGPLDIAGAIDKAVESLRPLAGEREIAISNTAPSRLPLASADADRLGQILRNLIRNAIAHTPPGGSIGDERGTARHDAGGHRSGHGRRHRPGTRAIHLRSLLPGRSRAFADHRRGGARLGDRQEPGAGPRRGDRRRQHPGSGAAFTFTLPVATDGKRPAAP